MGQDPSETAPPVEARGLAREQHDRVSERLANLYGEAPEVDRTVLYIVACVRRGERFHVLKIGQYAPQGAHDFFVLQATRARADVIVTSAAILRAEPHVVFRPQGADTAQLLRYRQVQTGRSELAELVVITESGEIPLSHPALAHAGGVRVFAPSTRASELRTRLPEQVRLQCTDEGGLGALIARLQSEGARRINLELGPTAAAPLLSAEGPITDFWLSEFSGPLDPRGIGPALPEDAALFAAFRALGRPHEITEASGIWRFSRYRKSAAAGCGQ